MTNPATPRPIVLRRVQLSTAAWQLLCESTSTTLGLETPASAQAPDAPNTPAELSTEAAAAAWDELNALDMSPAPGEVKRQWTGAVALLLTAPITITARASYQGVSTTSVLGLRAGRGLAAHQRHLSESGEKGTVITGSEDSMEITLFDEENVWGAAARLLPPLKVIQAGAKAAPLNSEPTLVVGPDSDPGALPQAAAALINDEDANVTLSVVTAKEGLPSRIWAGMWTVKDEQLFSVTSGTEAAPELRLTEVPAGHIANELLFAVVGAHDALTAAANAPTGTDKRQ
ncbi:hypothetical protein [Arthrobacter antibioticus]|uniref:hypothetical protein n=1 Tax=Arthrobacter sp. H35-MC1 TaxID=3046203 RepID=UPI0024BB6109|nr:hypothetical protein [Arthrobacter sp. H35-MC1]MDJ0317421.1 hypothetical protein [Arthrobacter sp. H35-MC1]